jgi:hypothetical protein
MTDAEGTEELLRILREAKNVGEFCRIMHIYNPFSNKKRNEVFLPIHNRQITENAF